MQTLYDYSLYTVYNVDSPVFYIQLIKAAVLKIKIMYLLSTGVKQPAFYQMRMKI